MVLISKISIADRNNNSNSSIPNNIDAPLQVTNQILNNETDNNLINDNSTIASISITNVESASQLSNSFYNNIITNISHASTIENVNTSSNVNENTNNHILSQWNITNNVTPIFCSIFCNFYYRINIIPSMCWNNIRIFFLY